MLTKLKALSDKWAGHDYDIATRNQSKDVVYDLNAASPSYKLYSRLRENYW